MCSIVYQIFLMGSLNDLSVHPEKALPIALAESKRSKLPRLVYQEVQLKLIFISVPSEIW